MKSNLVETVKFCFTDEVVDRLGMALGENPVAVKAGLIQAVPLVLDSVLRQAEREGDSGALLLLARKTDEISGATQQVDVSDANWYQQGSAILVELLGITYKATTSYLAQTAALRPEAAERLLQVTATAVLGILGKFATEKELLPSDFVRWLTLQKDRIEAAVLPVLRVAGSSEPARPAHPVTIMPPHQTAPLARPTAPGQPAAQATPPAASQSDTSSEYWEMLPWGLLLLLAMGLGYYFGHDQLAGRARTTTPVPATAVAAAEPTASYAGRYDQRRDIYIYDTGQPLKLTLADGTSEKVGASSTENRLYTFLADPTVQADSVNRMKGWINFDRVYFEPGKATLTLESAQQLRNVASILKTFPRAVVKIGGYTDSLGVALQNFQLSEERAKMAMFTLTALGIPADNLQFKGYGPRYFIAPNSTPEGRALNRRLSVRVIQK